MSADNWSKCPRCKKEAKEAREALRARAAEAYGTVPMAEFNNLNREANAPIRLEDTLREDYELGIDSDGNFYARYSGSCEKCALIFTFKHDEQVHL